jgi:hypothetical protein
MRRPSSCFCSIESGELWTVVTVVAGPEVEVIEGTVVELGLAVVGLDSAAAGLCLAVEGRGSGIATKSGRRLTVTAEVAGVATGADAGGVDADAVLPTAHAYDLTEAGA